MIVAVFPSSLDCGPILIYTTWTLMLLCIARPAKEGLKISDN